MSYFPSFFGHFESLASLRKWGDKPYTRAVKQDILVNIPNGQQLSNNFSKKSSNFDSKVRTNLTADTYRRLSQQKTMFFWEKIVAFLLFSGDKGDCSDVWMIKIKINTNEIDRDVCFFQK